MSLTTGEMSAADLAAVVGSKNDGFGTDGSWWIILLFLCLFNGGWNNGNNGNGVGGLYPWMNQADITNGGFRDQMINSGIDGIQNGINSLASQMCNGFAQAEIANNARQMADMNQAFTNQMATNQGFNNIQSSLASCCCENRLASADLKYTIANENCADRALISEGLRDILTATQNQTQTILTQLCNDKIEQKNDTIAQLRSELLYARGQASQDVQTAQILAGQVAEIDGMYNRLSTCPIPSVPVYGRQAIFNCNQNGGCGCGA